MPTSPRRRPSRTTSKRTKAVPAASKARGLAVDTSFSRHCGEVPQQVFPYESKTQELSFVRLNDIKPLTKKEGSKKHGTWESRLKQQLEKKATVPPSWQRVDTKNPSKLEKKALLEDTRQQPPPDVSDLGLRTGLETSNVPIALPQSDGHRAPVLLQPPPLHKRVKGLRNRQPDATNEISPSDRAIPIGIEIPSDALSQHTQSPDSAQRRSASIPQRHPGQTNVASGGQDGALPTPTIIITPAKENFDLGLNDDVRQGAGAPRAPSSVYSSYSNCLSTHPEARYDHTPPVPPMPLFAAKLRAKSARESNATIFEEEIARPKARRGKENVLSVCTLFEEESEEETSKTVPQKALKRQSSQALLPTPRRSRGWWNVIVSPFCSTPTPGSSFKSPFFRSSSLNASEVPRSLPAGDDVSSHTGLMNRSADDDELRSAPPTGRLSSLGPMPRPKRSDTAPGAMDRGMEGSTNIYRVPSQGLATAYYDANRRFPSMYHPADNAGKDLSADRGMARGLDFPEGWSPSQSVYNEPREDHHPDIYDVPSTGLASSYYDQNRNFPSTYQPLGADRQMDEIQETWSPSQSVYRPSSGAQAGGLAIGPTAHDEDFVKTPFEKHFADRGFEGRDEPRSPLAMPQSPQMRDTENSPFADSHAAEIHHPPYPVDRSPFDDVHAADFQGFSGTHPAVGQQAGFYTPREEELRNATPVPGLESQFSPLSPTPVVEDAHMATYFGPHAGAAASAREVDLTPGPPRPETPITPVGVGLGDATMSSSRNVDEPAYLAPMDERMQAPYEPAYTPPYHSRNNSQGLGITDSDAGSERALFPAPEIFSEKEQKVGQGTLKKEKPDEDVEGKRPWYRRCRVWLGVLAALLVAITIVLLVLLIPLHPGKDVAVEAQWLNLTGFPPMPTGVTTVIEPKVVKEVSGCVSPQVLWGCGIPAGEGLTSGSDQTPDFRFEIAFKNHTLPSNETIAITKRSSRAAGAKALVRRNSWSRYLFSPSPSPPSTDDQIFIGQTTDNVSQPYNGEETPFYISILNPTALSLHSSSKKLRKRDDKTFSYPYPISSSSASISGGVASINSVSSVSTAPTAAASSIPTPSMQDNNDPSPAEIYPLATAQPLRLYNRGQESEHYGFYTYYDRSLYISGTNTSKSASGNGIVANVPFANASALCTWSQTRFLVQMWTRKSSSDPITAVNPLTNMTTAEAKQIPDYNSTANDMIAPGSFPYPVTITLDRHGGEADMKGVYCYALNENHQVEDNVRRWVAENRGFGGQLVNPGAVPGANGTSLDRRDRIEGSGIDGGTGGCECQWQNWG